MTFIKTITGRKGITPVVAIVMLLMLTLVVGGGVMAFLTGFFEEQTGDIEAQRSTNAEFRGLTCIDNGGSNADFINFTLRNTGDTNIDLNSVDIYVRSVSNSQLLHTITTSGGAMAQMTVDDRLWSDSETLNPATEANLSAGNAYTIEFEFTSNGGHPFISRRCTAQ